MNVGNWRWKGSGVTININLFFFFFQCSSHYHSVFLAKFSASLTMFNCRFQFLSVTSGQKVSSHLSSVDEHYYGLEVKLRCGTTYAKTRLSSLGTPLASSTWTSKLLINPLLRCLVGKISQIILKLLCFPVC